MKLESKLDYLQQFKTVTPNKFFEYQTDHKLTNSENRHVDDQILSLNIIEIYI